MESQTFDRNQLNNCNYIYKVLINRDSDTNWEIKRPVPAYGIYKQLSGYMAVDFSNTSFMDHVKEVARAAVDFYNNKHYAMIGFMSAKFLYSYPTAFLITVLTDKDIFIKAELGSYGVGKRKDFWVCETSNEE